MKGTTEDEMVEWHQRLDGHESEQTLGDSEEQGSLACCSPWGCKELDTTQQLNNSKGSTLRSWYKVTIRTKPIKLSKCKACSKRQGKGETDDTNKIGYIINDYIPDKYIHNSK